MPPPTRVESPCVRLCTLDEQDVCVGCGRTIQEITGWSAMSEPEKLATLDRAAGRCRKRNEKRKKWTHD